MYPSVYASKYLPHPVFDFRYRTRIGDLKTWILARRLHCIQIFPPLPFDKCPKRRTPIFAFCFACVNPEFKWGPWSTVHIGCGVHLPFCPTGTDGWLLWVKLPLHEPTVSAKIKNTWSYIYTSPYVFMAWGLIKNTENLTSSLRYLFKGVFIL